MGSVGEFGEVIQLSSPVAETFAAAEEGAVIKPTVVKVNEITETMLNRLIQVNNATVNLEGGKTLVRPRSRWMVPLSGSRNGTWFPLRQHHAAWSERLPPAAPRHEKGSF